MGGDGGGAGSQQTSCCFSLEHEGVTCLNSDVLAVHKHKV